eukprot:14307139-Alexandrium_andersonii.AAC.1
MCSPHEAPTQQPNFPTSQGRSPFNFIPTPHCPCGNERAHRADDGARPPRHSGDALAHLSNYPASSLRISPTA